MGIINREEEKTRHRPSRTRRSSPSPTRTRVRTKKVYLSLIFPSSLSLLISLTSRCFPPSTDSEKRRARRRRARCRRRRRRAPSPSPRCPSSFHRRRIRTRPAGSAASHARGPPWLSAASGAPVCPRSSGAGRTAERRSGQVPLLRGRRVG